MLLYEYTKIWYTVGTYKEMEKDIRNMDSVRKKAGILGRLKWLGILSGIIMYYSTVHSFGNMISTILGCVAAVAFYVICENERRRSLSSCVSEHLSEVLAKLGQEENIFEIKSTGTQMIVRIYLIRARERALLCSKAVLDAIDKSWYCSKVLITQIVDIDKKEDMEQMRSTLDEDLFEQLKKM